MSYERMGDDKAPPPLQTHTNRAGSAPAPCLPGCSEVPGGVVRRWMYQSCPPGARCGVTLPPPPVPPCVQTAEGVYCCPPYPDETRCESVEPTRAAAASTGPLGLTWAQVGIGVGVGVGVVALLGFWLRVRKNPSGSVFPDGRFPVKDASHQRRALGYVKAGRVASGDDLVVLRWLRDHAKDDYVRAEARKAIRDWNRSKSGIVKLSRSRHRKGIRRRAETTRRKKHRAA